MWLALDVVDEENGCVRYVRGSHRRGMRPHGRTGVLGFSQGITDYGQPEDLADEIAFPAQPGDLLVHHALTIHRADGNRSATRHPTLFGFHLLRRELERRCGHDDPVSEAVETRAPCRREDLIGPMFSAHPSIIFMSP